MSVASNHYTPRGWLHSLNKCYLNSAFRHFPSVHWAAGQLTFVQQAVHNASVSTAALAEGLIIHILVHIWRKLTFWRNLYCLQPAMLFLFVCWFVFFNLCAFVWCSIENGIMEVHYQLLNMWASQPETSRVSLSLNILDGLECNHSVGSFIFIH